MMVKYNKMMLFLLILSTVFIYGCEILSENDTVTYITPSKNSTYEKTFKALQLGEVFDYNYKLINANETSVKGWLELYEDGALVDDTIGGFSYTLAANKSEEEGNLGFGVIKSINDNFSVFFYTPAFTMAPMEIKYDLSHSENIYVWHQPDVDGTLAINKGEEVVLAVYREVSGSEVIKYDYQDPSAIEKMINEDHKVMLFKFKIDN